jgi:hypothetical protein
VSDELSKCYGFFVFLGDEAARQGVFVTLGKMRLAAPAIRIVPVLANICLGNRRRIDHNNQ